MEILLPQNLKRVNLVCVLQQIDVELVGERGEGNLGWDFRGSGRILGWE